MALQERVHGRRRASAAGSSAPFLSFATTLVLLLLSAPSALAYNFEKSITIDRTKISDASCGTTLSSYPMLFSVTDPDLAHTTSGGKVTDLGGDDIIFVARDATTCGGPASCILDHEIERYVNTTGQLIAWVRIPAVKTALAASNTVIYINYGNSAVTSPTENPTGVWDSSFRAVWHLEENVVDEAVGAVHVDSTSNGNNGSQNGNVEGMGRIADGQDFDGVDDYIAVPNPGVVNPVTVSAWVKHDALPASIQRYLSLNNIVSIRHDGANSVGQVDFFIRGGGGTAYHLRANGALTVGGWYHVVGTWDGAVQRLFLNGAQVLSQPVATTLDPIGGTNVISQMSEPMDGILDEVRVSDTARSACWIDADYDNQSNPGDIGAPGFYTVGAETGRYAFLKPITVDRAQIPGSCGTTLANYPMLFSVTDPDLANIGSGGDVTDLGGDDIIFKAHDAATCGGPSSCTLDHEIEKYVSTTGELVAWVRIPSVNTAAAASDSVIYVYYGNSAVTSPTENPDGVWDANYVGVWHLAESGTGAVGEFVDSSGAGNHGQGGAGTANRVPTQITNGVIGNAQTFDNTDDNVRIPNSASLGITGDITVTGWVKRTNLDWLAILTKTNLSSRYDYQFLISVSDTLGLWADGASPTVINTTDTITDTTWHHLSVSKSGNNVTFYVDGAAAAGGGVQTGGINNNPDPVVIGYDNESSSAIGGNLDELRLSNSARSSCWIKASYNNEVWPNKAVTPSPNPSPNPSTGFYTVGAATSVKLVSFSARGLDGRVEISWETGSEVDNLGFHLYRSTSSSGPYERVTASLIPGLGSSPSGARYRYVDTGLANGVTYYYELEDVETTGRVERHGLVSATPLLGAGSGEDGSLDERGSASVITYGEPEANGLRVVKRGRNQVVLELRTEGFVAYPEPDGSVRLEIADYLGIDEQGLPSKTTWVEAVAGRRVELLSVREHDVETVGLRPGEASEDEVVGSRDGVVELRKRGGRSAKRGGASDGARLLSVGFQGEVKKALVEMSPLSWDGSRQELRLAKKLEVTLSFAKRDEDERVSRDGRRGRRSRVTDRPRSEGVMARLATRAPGLYAVRYEELFGKGNRRGVEAAQLRLSRLGEAVAFHLEPSASRFEPGATLYFVSPGAEANPYGDEAVFELAYGVSDGVSMTVRDVTASGAVTSVYLRRDAHEENHIYQATLRESETRWMWELLFAPARKGYRFSVNALASGAEPSRLELWLQGGTDFPASPDHHVVVYVNGTPVAERSWNGKLGQRFDVELWPGVLREGENLLEVENVGDTGAPYSMVYMDRCAVTYPRLARAEEGWLEGRWMASGTAEVSGVSPAVSLVDTTGAQPMWLTGAASSSDGVVRFRAEAERRYLVVDAQRVQSPEVRRASAPRWTSGSHQADYVVLGPRAFLEAAEPLLDHRRRQGLATVAVPVEEVYAELGYGESRPEALRDFLTYAYHHWSAPSPRYVLLLGDATYDFKNYYGTGVVNRVPPLMVETSYLSTASDPTYAAVNGDDLLPDLAIGRLPAANVDEVRTMVGKILAYETGEATLQGAVVLVSDDPDSAGDFPADAEALAATVLAGRATEHISLQELGAAATRRAVRDAFDGGASVVSYIGHGGIHVWANENLLDVTSVASLSTQPQQPLLLTMNCLNGYFHFPFFDSLSEELVKAEGKGAIAAFSPSGMSLNGPAQLYHQALLDALFHGAHGRLGDAVLAAQEVYAASGSFPELLSIYHLLGDPALTLR